MFYSPMIRSHPFSECVLLDCKLQGVSRFFSPPLRWDRMSRMFFWGVGISLPQVI